MRGFLFFVSLHQTIYKMIDEVYQLSLVLLSKDSQGWVTPEEFNKVAKLAQDSIFRGYFEDENRDKNKQNRGLSNEGYANLAFIQRQRIDQFAATATLVKVGDVYPLPADLYLIEEDGIYRPSTFTVAEEVERKDLAYLNKSEMAPSELYPVYERFAKSIKIYPNIALLDNSYECRYLRKPKTPKWTYFELPDGEVKFDITNPSYQDFDLHESEFPNLVTRIVGHFGLTIREPEVVQAAEALKNEIRTSDNG